MCLPFIIICRICIAMLTVVHIDISYHTITLLHLLPMMPQLLSNVFLISLAEGIEQNRGTQRGFFVDKADKFFHTFTSQTLKYESYIFHTF